MRMAQEEKGVECLGRLPGCHHVRAKTYGLHVMMPPYAKTKTDVRAPGRRGVAESLRFLGPFEHAEEESNSNEDREKGRWE